MNTIIITLKFHIVFPQKPEFVIFLSKSCRNFLFRLQKQAIKEIWGRQCFLTLTQIYNTTFLLSMHFALILTFTIALSEYSEIAFYFQTFCVIDGYGGIFRVLLRKLLCAQLIILRRYFLTLSPITALSADIFQQLISQFQVAFHN